jgi:hypothetical protein
LMARFIFCFQMTKMQNESTSFFFFFEKGYGTPCGASA